MDGKVLEICILMGDPWYNESFTTYSTVKQKIYCCSEGSILSPTSTVCDYKHHQSVIRVVN